MKRCKGLGLAVLMMTASCSWLTVPWQESSSGKRAKEENAMSICDFTVQDIDGNDVKLARYHGDVLMIVNVASE